MLSNTRGYFLQPVPGIAEMAVKHLTADLLMVSVTVLAAAGWVFSKQALQGLPPALFLGVRFVLAGMLLAVIGFHQLRRLDTGELLRAGLTGAVMGVALLCWIQGLSQASNMGVAAFITSLGVILVPVVGRVLFGISVSMSTWNAVLVAGVGIGCLALEQGLRLAPSDLYFVATAFGLAVHFNLNTRYAIRIPVLALTAVQLSVVGGLALLISIAVEPWPTDVSAEVMGWLLASIVIATSLRFFLQVKAQSLAPLAHAAIIMTLEPVWTALIAAAWLGERMSGTQLAGCSLIFLALLINRWRWILRRPKIATRER